MNVQTQTIETIRASFLPIAAKCPGSMHDFGEVSIRQDAGVVTAGGSAAHEVCREIVRTADRPEDLSPYVEKHGCDPDHLGRATWYALEFWREHRGAFPDPQTELALEADLPGGMRLTGHVDLHSIYADIESRPLDWKAGYRTDVDCEAQLRGYSFLSCQHFGTEKASATVVWLADQTYQTWEWTWDELREWAADLVKRIQEWDGKYTVGDHCRYCPRFFGCPAQKMIVQTTVEDLAMMDSRPGEIQPGRLAELYPAVQSVERLCEAFRDTLRATVAANGPIPVPDGKQLALIPSNRESIDAQIGWPVLAQHLSQNELAPCVKIRKTELLKAVADKAPRGQKGKVKTALMDELHDAGAVSTKVTNSLRVVRRETQ